MGYTQRLNSKLINRITKTETKDVVHNGAFASAQKQGYLDVSNLNHETFADRRKMEHNRQNIQAYKVSSIAQGGNRYERAMTAQEQSAMAKMQQATGSVGGNNQMTLQEANIKMHKQGLQKFDKGMRAMNGEAEVMKTPANVHNSMAKTPETHVQRQASGYRAMQAERFAGGVRKYNPTGGGAAAAPAPRAPGAASRIAPNIKPNFGGR